MRQNTCRWAIALTAIASLAACTDSRQPTDLIAAFPPGSGPNGITCKPATPDSLIPLPVAPPARRVDLGTPVFSNPTSVTNPLFPISGLDQVVLVGFVGGVPFRAETSLLPETKRIDLGSSEVETLTSQYVAYLDRRIDETAIDQYGQDDAGAVWYFGEEVSNYEDGEIVDTDGTWLACQDGPVAMIMPAHPTVGDVYRVENIFPVVFEEIEILKTDQTLPGPLGPVAGAFEVTQLHLDGHYEPKAFAPAYGEFSTGSNTDIEELAIAIPTDAAGVPTPASLRQLLSGARRVFQAAGRGNWRQASRTAEEMTMAWQSYQATTIPRLLKPLMAGALSDLTGAVSSREAAATRQFALDVTKWGLDLLLQYQSRAEVDFARLDLWSRQLVVDAGAEDTGGIASDLAIMGRILDRLKNTGDRRQRADVRAVEEQLARLRTATRLRSSPELMAGAERLQQVLNPRVLHQES